MNETFKFTTYNDGRMEDAEILLSSILEFSTYNTKTFYRHGGFKKWFKKGRIRILGDKVYRVSYYNIQSLRKILKGKYKVSKYTKVEYKNSPSWRHRGDRKATDWNYKIIK